MPKAARKRRKRARRSSKGFDVRSLRETLGRLGGKKLAPRSELARLAGVHVNTISNWEGGSVPTARKLARLVEIARRAASGKLPRKARSAGKARKDVRPRSAEPARNGAVDVLALRRALGSLSRVKFAKLLGASPGSIENWEKKKTVPSRKFVARLEGLARKNAGKPVAPAPHGRTTTGASPRGGRTAKVVGEVSVVYANAVSVALGAGEARLRFGLVVPGERGARAIADVVVPIELLERIG